MAMKKRTVNGYGFNNLDRVPQPKELDKRYTGDYQFHYCIDFYYKQGPLFREVRNWCWDTWGPSCELKFIDQHEELKWAWITDNHRTRIYLCDTAEVNWYKLRWL
jgi:hypothetical protein